jgi:hypothetical protein
MANEKLQRSSFRLLLNNGCKLVALLRAQMEANRRARMIVCPTVLIPHTASEGM